MKQSSDSIKKEVASTALVGATGMTIIGAAAVGVAGYFLWKNRSRVLSFIGKYVDLPESLEDIASKFESDSEDEHTPSTLSSAAQTASKKLNTVSPSTQRM